MSKAKVLLCTALMLSVTGSVYAADPANLSDQQGVITFNGSLTGDTCDIDGEKSFTVYLPQLSTQALKSAGTEAGSKPFKIAVKNCSASLKNITAHFEAVGGSAKDMITGNLTNTSTASTAAKNVQVRIYQDDKQLALGDTGTAVALVNQAAVMSFAGGYYSTGAATAGQVEAKAIYTLAYP